MACMSSCTASAMIPSRPLPPGGLDSCRPLQAAQPLLEDAAALEARDQAPPGVCLLGGKGAGVYARCRDRVAHGGFGRDHHVVGDAEMPGDADHPADHASLADDDAAGD